MSSANSEKTPIDELVAGNIIGDLSVEEEKELSSRASEIDEESRWELQVAAASLQVAEKMNTTPIDSTLLNRIREEGYRSIGASESPIEDPGTTLNIHVPQSDDEREMDIVPDVAEAAPKTTINGREVVAWLSLAAALLLCLGLWKAQTESTVAVNASEMRAQLIAESDELGQFDWAEGPTPFDQSVKGDIIWDNSRQEGYMRFVGMPVNDPSVEQYQLWIVDPSRDEKPIDGGVFDIRSTGEVVVKIDAKLAVIDPTLFAITIEKPGGVVVSSQERLPLLASVDG